MSLISQREKARVRWMTQAFDAAKRNAQLIKYLNSDSAEKANVTFGKDLELLKELEEDVAAFFQRITDSDNNANGAEYLISDEERDEILDKLKGELKQSFKTICLKSKKSELTESSQFNEETWSIILNDFIFYLDSQESIFTSTEEKKEVLIQNKLTKKTTLQKELKIEQELLEQQREIREFNKTQIASKTAKLKNDVKILKSRMEVQTEMYDNKEKKLSNLDESHKKRITELDKKQEDLKKSLTTLKEQNAEREGEIRKKLKRSKNELNDLTEECSVEMIHLSKEMQEALKLEKKNLEEIAKLKKKVDVLVEAREKIEAEEERIRQEKLLKEQQINLAATQIQASFRGWKTRRDLKKKKGKGKKGKKGKKKK